ncbi:protein IQ-DOMAIN 14, partial [Neltuma alba]|uniref:protein IQ-DOMAIN 14 n=1 Tax=Neltuma alba TaxID=207710 RepID=UPI0010A2C474
SKTPKEKRRWSFVKSYREHDNLPTTTAVKTGIHNNDNHSITVAAAPALRLRSGGRCVQATAQSTANREEWAAVKIQAAFRGCLARRALRALKGLVKLQALVRGQVARKRTAERLQKMQLHLRAQTRVRAGRLSSSLMAMSSNVHLHDPATPDKVENPIRSKSMKYDQSSILKISGNKEKCWKTTDSWVDEKSWNRQRSSVRICVNDERNVRILEMDSEKRNLASKRRARNLFHSANLALVSDPYSQNLIATKNSTIHHSGPIHREIHQSYSPPEGHEVDETPFCTANNSPPFFSGSSRDGSSKRSPFTPTKSDGSRSYVSAYSDCPNYMAYTESSKAKVRSLSAPKQRTRYERSGSSNRYSMNGFGESRLSAQRASALHASFTSKAYPGSGRLDKFGLPMGHRY